MSKGFSGSSGTRGGSGGSGGSGSGGGSGGNTVSKITVSKKAYDKRGDSDKHPREVARDTGKSRHQKGVQKKPQQQ